LANVGSFRVSKLSSLPFHQQNKQIKEKLEKSSQKNAYSPCYFWELFSFSENFATTQYYASQKTNFLYTKTSKQINYSLAKIPLGDQENFLKRSGRNFLNTL
jgi:hypothetical protein